MALVCLGWCLIFFIFNVGFRVFKEKKPLRIEQEAETLITGKRREDSVDIQQNLIPNNDSTK